MAHPPTIDHDPNEGAKVPNWYAHLRPDSEYTRRAKADDFRWLWPAVFLMLVLLWVWFFVYETPHWVSIGIGFGTGLMVASWGADSEYRRRKASRLESGETDD